MKLKNKKTGGIYKIEDIDLGNNADGIWLGMTKYLSLAELNEEWEDYEEPKEYWYIDYDGGILCGESDNSSAEKMMISMGNHFESLEEAEKAVEKLKAVKRLKDKGFRFDSWKNDNEKYLGDFVIYAHTKDLTDIVDDLDLLFGGEKWN